MAEVVVAVDTTKCTMKVALDGKEIPNIVDISMSQMLDNEGDVSYQYMRFSTREMVSDNVYKLVDYYSSGSPPATAALQSGEAMQCDIPGFVAVSGKSKAQQDIAKYFSGKHR